MSTNTKNVIRPEFLKNFTTKIKRRYIVIESTKNSTLDYPKIIGEINTKVNQIIQEINIKTVDRQIPYITLIAQYNTSLNERSRIVIHNQHSSAAYRECVKCQADEIGASLSHCIDLLVCEGYKEIIISSLEYDAEIVVGRKFITCAIIDLLLDIAMFNSYSFLKEKPLSWKHNFSFEKYDFFVNRNLDCFYECKTSKKLYYSFAFSARRTENDFDVERYISIWNEFTSHNYGDKKHHEKTTLEQLHQHVDFKELPANLLKSLQSYPDGAYLVLRTNKDRTETLHPFICTAFGLEEYERGKIKIVSVSEFEIYRPMLENLDVSAFKVVINHSDVLKSSDETISKTDMSNSYQQNSMDTKNSKRFKIALSFPGEYRNLVGAIAEQLAGKYGKKSILYDNFLRAELARPNLDTYLEKLFAEDSELIVLFICSEYDKKPWCGIEWRAIRRLLNKQHDERIMLIKCGDGEVKGLDKSTDGYIDASTVSLDSLVEDIVERYKLLYLYASPCL